MGLLDDLQKPNQYNLPQGEKCHTCRLLSELPVEEAEALRQALENKKIKGSALARILKTNGHNVGDTSIARHRRGDCLGTNR